MSIEKAWDILNIALKRNAVPLFAREDKDYYMFAAKPKDNRLPSDATFLSPQFAVNKEDGNVISALKLSYIGCYNFYKFEDGKWVSSNEQT